MKFINRTFYLTCILELFFINKYMMVNAANNFGLPFNITQQPYQQQQQPIGQNQQPPGTQNQQPPGTQNQQPPGTQNQQPPAAQNQQPPGTQNQQPPAAQNQQQTGAQNQQPNTQTPSTDDKSKTLGSTVDKYKGWFIGAFVLLAIVALVAIVGLAIQITKRG